MTNYMIFNEKTINNNFKFQVGKRYKINHNLCESGYTFFKNFGEIELKTHIYPEIKICEVIVFDKKKDLNGKHKTFDFKIKKEINYKNKINSERLQKEISILKCHDNKIINEVLNSDFNYIYYSDIITTKISRYLDIICSKFPVDNVLEEVFIEYVNEKHINMIINKSTNVHALFKILNFFGTKYFDKIYESIKEKYGESSEEIRILNDKIIKQKSRKYISNLISNESYHFEIAKTGIDIIENNFNHFSKVYLLDIGRKKDLDMFVNIEERNFSLEIIDKQYDDHLRLLRHNKNIAVSEKAKKIIDECELN